MIFGEKEKAYLKYHEELLVIRAKPMTSEESNARCLVYEKNLREEREQIQRNKIVAQKEEILLDKREKRQVAKQNASPSVPKIVRSVIHHNPPCRACGNTHYVRDEYMGNWTCVSCDGGRTAPPGWTIVADP
jgi:ribosomal protein L37AE/L43A